MGKLTYVKEGENKVKVFNLIQKIKEKKDKEIQDKSEKRQKKIREVLNKRMTYKSSNPLRSLIGSNKNRSKIYLKSNGGQKVNLNKFKW